MGWLDKRTVCEKERPTTKYSLTKMFEYNKRVAEIITIHFLCVALTASDK